MRRVYKWPLLGPDHPDIVSKVPWGWDDKVLLIADQRGTLTLWAEQEDERPPTPRLFEVVGTGGIRPEGMEHVGSAVCGDFVWHVYAQPVEVPF